MKNADKPIHPVTEADLERAKQYPDNMCLGLTKLEYFTGIAISKLDEKIFVEQYGILWDEEFVKVSILFAKEILKQLENE